MTNCQGSQRPLGGFFSKIKKWEKFCCFKFYCLKKYEGFQIKRIEGSASDKSNQKLNRSIGTDQCIYNRNHPKNLFLKRMKTWINFSISWLTFQRICFKSNFLPQFESHSNVTAKYFRLVLGTNFQVFIKTYLFSSLLKYAEWEIRLFVKNVFKLLWQFRKDIGKHC